MGSLLLCILHPIFFVVGLVGAIAWLVVVIRKDNEDEKNNQKGYSSTFKEKIIKPIIENMIEKAVYEPKKGFNMEEYNKANYREQFNRYSSEDLVIADIVCDNNINTQIKFAEVHTKWETEKHGTTTVFNGLVCEFALPKNIGKTIFVRTNGRTKDSKPDKINMDMTKFEEGFDVESDDKILAMRILTSDVMVELVDLYEKYNYEFEISIINDVAYIRIRTGELFEPSVIESSLQYKLIEKYYLIIKALLAISTHICDTIYRLEV